MKKSLQNYEISYSKAKTVKNSMMLIDIKKKVLWTNLEKDIQKIISIFGSSHAFPRFLTPKNPAETR